MIKFDLKKALEGRLVVTEKGETVSDLHHFSAAECVGGVLHLEDGSTRIGLWNEQGVPFFNSFVTASPNIQAKDFHLKLIPYLKKGFMPIFRRGIGGNYGGCVYDTKEEAEKFSTNELYITTITVEWEE